MAFYDDHRFLLSHIQHSFVTCDETGMCEMVMLSEDIPHSFPAAQDKELSKELELDWCGANSTDPDFEVSEIAQSCDIVSDMGLIGHRRRSNTALRLEKLKEKKKHQAKMKTVYWKEPNQPLDGSEMAELFPKKPLVKKYIAKTSSALSEILTKYPAPPRNPFIEFAKFDARPYVRFGEKVSDGIAVKKISIYLTMLPEEERNYPMEVVTLASAKIQDVIGLICWQYTCENRQPKLMDKVDKYSLRIAEENGEIDPDFPSLDLKEPIAKFGFPILAFIERPANEKDDPKRHLVRMYIDDTLSQATFTDLDVTVRDVLTHMLQGSKDVDKVRVVKHNDPTTLIHLDTPLKNAETLEFSLLIQNGSDGFDRIDDWATQDMIAMEAPLYQSYMVSMIQKLGKNIDVQLGISGEKVEINPLPQKGAAKLWTWQQKPVTHNVDQIAACELISRKYSAGKAVFKLIYCSGNEYKNYMFETETRRAQEIVKKVRYILEIHSSQVQRDYRAMRERKMQKKYQQQAANFR